MQLSKVTSWGLILGGLLGILGFMAFALALGLMDEDIAPADELKAFQDNQLFEKSSCLKRYGVYHFTKEPYPFSERGMCVRKLYIVLPYMKRPRPVSSTIVSSTPFLTQ